MAHPRLGTKVGPVTLKGRDGDAGFGRGATAAIDWNGDGVVDLVVLETEDGDMWAKSADGIVPEDQRDRYDKDGKWFSKFGTASLHLYRNTSSGGDIEFTYAGRVDVDVPRHTFHISEVNPDDPTAGLLLLNYYGHINHVSILATGDVPNGASQPRYSPSTASRSAASPPSSRASASPTRWRPGDSTSLQVTTPETSSGHGTTARTPPTGPSMTRPASSSSTTPTSTAGSSPFPRSATGETRGCRTSSWAASRGTSSGTRPSRPIPCDSLRLSACATAPPRSDASQRRIRREDSTGAAPKAPTTGTQADTATPFWPTGTATASSTSSSATW